MNTNFFSAFKSLGVQGAYRMAIYVTGETMCVSILPVADDKEPTKYGIPPLVFNNLPAEMIDNAFFNDISAPLQRLNTVLANKAAFEKQTSKVAEQPAKPSASSSSKVATPAVPAKYTAAMNKVEQLEKQGKIGQAISSMPKASEFPAQKEAIETKLADLKAKHGGFTSLFSEPSGSPAATPQHEQRNPAPAPQPDVNTFMEEDSDTTEESEEEEDWSSTGDPTDEDEEEEESTFFNH